MGESKRKLVKSQEMLTSCTGVQTAGGRVQVRWESASAATPMGQLAYFIEFLTLTGLWSRWQEGFPLPYVSPNAPTKSEVLGTWMLSILSGHKRYSHVTAIGCDGVNPGLLGMKKVISEDAMRRALSATPEAEGVAWLDGHLEQSVAPLLDAAWILDIDTTVKPLYGKQEGALVSYNPKKPGRPSHTYHTYLMAGLRLVVGAEVHAGDEHSGSHSLPGLLKILDALPPERRPKMVRGDCGFGSDTFMGPLEERGQPYLFKLRLSKNVKRHIERVFWDADWRDAGQGWEGKDGSLRLCGWKRARRVVVLRRPIKGEVLIASEDDAQGLLGFVEVDRKTGKRTTGYETAVLVTNLEHEILSLGQLYRDRADAENAFDELKNRWGWGGFTTHDLHRCQLSARAVALVYNWWSIFVRLANPKARREAFHQPAVVDVLYRTQDRTRRADDDHAHRIACAFRQGQRGADACLCLAQALDGPCCEAVESVDRLAPRLRPYQADPRWGRTTSASSIPRKSRAGNRLTAVFRMNARHRHWT